MSAVKSRRSRGRDVSSHRRKWYKAPSPSAVAGILSSTAFEKRTNPGSSTTHTPAHPAASAIHRRAQAVV